MKLTVNEKTLEVDLNSTVEQLLKLLDSPAQGCAIAVNQEIISRLLWPEFELKENDQVSLFQAIAGG